jgi:hypothetical protein
MGPAKGGNDPALPITGARRAFTEESMYSKPIPELSMAFRLNLPRQGLEDMTRIKNLGRERLQNLAARLAGATDVVSPADLRAKLNDVPPDTAESLLRQTLSLWRLSQQQGVTPNEVLDAITASLKSPHSSWTESDHKQWPEIAEILANILKLESLHVVAKTLDLESEQPFIFKSARVITDMRPIFDDARKVIRGSLILQTLRLEYVSSDGEHDLYIGLDDADLRTIIQECTTAIDKGTATRQLIEGCKLKAIPAGSAV